MVTMPKDRMATRVASSLLRAANMSELITNSLEEYEELAVALASDMDRLWSCVGGLRTSGFAARCSTPSAGCAT